MLQAMVNVALEGGLHSEHSGSDTNRRNGRNRKVIPSHACPLEILTPRDWNGNHEPILIKKWERELGSGLNEVILSLYARGQSIDDVLFFCVDGLAGFREVIEEVYPHSIIRRCIVHVIRISVKFVT